MQRVGIERLAAMPQSLASFVREHVGGILAVFVVFSWCTVLFKWVQYYDKASFWVLIVVAFGWIIQMIGIEKEHNESDAAYATRRAGRRRIARVWQIASIAAFPVIFVLLPPINNMRDPSSVWVRAYDGATSLFDETMYINPLRTVVYDVAVNQGISVNTKAKSRDGIPLICYVNVGGVYLDRRDPSQLAAFLGERSKTGDPGDFIQRELRNATTASLVSVIASKTAEEIASPTGKFTIPFAVGSPLYETLARLHLRFSDGGVQPSCRNLFES